MTAQLRQTIPIHGFAFFIQALLKISKKICNHLAPKNWNKTYFPQFIIYFFIYKLYTIMNMLTMNWIQIAIEFCMCAKFYIWNLFNKSKSFECSNMLNIWNIYILQVVYFYLSAISTQNEIAIRVNVYTFGKHHIVYQMLYVLVNISKLAILMVITFSYWFMDGKNFVNWQANDNIWFYVL